MKIVVDAMGGDFAPKVNVDGAIDALREYPDMDIILVGPQALVEETISAYGDAEALGRVRERLTSTLPIKWNGCGFSISA